ncbi:hypothetical protein ACLOJK_034177 [Asimina triloba]
MATRRIEFRRESVDLNVSLFIPLSPNRRGVGIGLDLNVRPEENPHPHSPYRPSNASYSPASVSHAAANLTYVGSLGLEESSQQRLAVHQRSPSLSQAGLMHLVSSPYVPNSPSSEQHNALASGVHPNNVIVNDHNSPYSPSSPSYTPLSPSYTPLSPSYSPRSPSYSPQSPSPVTRDIFHFSSEDGVNWVDDPYSSSYHAPPSPPAQAIQVPVPELPSYDPLSPTYSPTQSLPIYSPARSSPVYSHFRLSPAYSPSMSSPTYSPAPTSPTYNPIPLSQTYTPVLMPAQANGAQVLEGSSQCYAPASLSYVPLSPAIPNGETSVQNASLQRELHMEIRSQRLVESASQRRSRIFGLTVDDIGHDAGASARSAEMPGIRSVPEEEITKDESSNASDFECNICLEMAKEPVVTSCGHLFCWPCLYLWLHVHSDHKECPMCKGEVTESNITPIYGRGNFRNGGAGDRSGLRIPPRPHACRIESLRQRLSSQPSGTFVDDSWSAARAMDEEFHELQEMAEEFNRQSNQALLFRTSSFDFSRNAIEPASATQNGNFHASGQFRSRRFRNELFLDEELHGMRLQARLPMSSQSSESMLNSRLARSFRNPPRNPSELVSNTQNANLLADGFLEGLRNGRNNLLHHVPVHNPLHSDRAAVRTAGISDVMARAVDSRNSSSGPIYTDSQLGTQLQDVTVARSREGQVSATGAIEHQGLGYTFASAVDMNPEYFPSVRQRDNASGSLDAGWRLRHSQRRRLN